MTLAIGNPAIITETPVILSGYKKQIDVQAWVIKSVTHALNEAGITSALDLDNVSE